MKHNHRSGSIHCYGAESLIIPQTLKHVRSLTLEKVYLWHLVMFYEIVLIQGNKIQFKFQHLLYQKNQNELYANIWFLTTDYSWSHIKIPVSVEMNHIGL